MSTSFEVIYDRTGFPMIWVEEIRCHVHWLPVTKIQIEHFLCDISDSAFDADWYQTILELTPRISPREINECNYLRAFAAGLYPTEAERFARWCGEDYSLPTVSEWFTLYRTLRDVEAPPPEWNDVLAPRVHLLLSRTQDAWKRASKSRGLPDTRVGHMLMRLGFLEWVEDRGASQRWAGAGLPHPDLHSVLTNPDHGTPTRPLHPERNRHADYGFRLVKREVS